MSSTHTSRLTLDELAREYRPGMLLRVQSGPTTRLMSVLGVCWSLPLEPGGPDEPAIVTQDRDGIGNVYVSEILSKVRG